MRIENQRMVDFLASHGIRAQVKYIWNGSLKGTWRLYSPNVRWTMALASKLNSLGFKDFDGKPLHEYSGNGGLFSVFVRGHKEFAEDQSGIGEPDVEKNMLAREIVRIAKQLMAIDFPTQDAMEKYLKDHPDANRSNHKVVKSPNQPDKKGWKPETDKERKEKETWLYKFEDLVRKGGGKMGEGMWTNAHMHHGQGLTPEKAAEKYLSWAKEKKKEPKKGSDVAACDLLREAKEMVALSVPEQHQKAIALKTLKMNDAMANVMGGMDKEEARAFLKSIGYSDSQIEKIENG